MYRLFMHSAARLILAFLLTVALTFGGVPMAHALPASVPVPPAAHAIHTHGADTGHAMHHQMQNETVATVQKGTVPDKPGNTVADLCKGLKCCSMCATAYVMPSLRNLNVDRVFLAVDYAMLVIAHTQTVTFIDPGIPIV